MSAVSSTVEVRILRFGRLATLGKLARLCVGNPKDFKTTNDFVSRHEGESKTRGMNRKSRGNGGEARV
ncbi:hypothetical protein HID58_054518 [Brassica napus]|uniref:(rape) hypothetical protein n=1 Tax=Brassica napus TaxID=3708 RepID=A0A816IK65_BRANA|nr:hypothetical protein HID58_054518 [Brassica napus]CAF1706170.1 unnamed protein product [Brassica napus]